MNAPVRVLLLEVPKLLREMLEQAIRRDSGCELIFQRCSVLETLSKPVDPPDVVIVGLTAVEDIALVPALFGHWPSAQVVTVLQTDGDVSLYELSPSRQSLGEISPSEIFSTLRDSIRRRRERVGESFATP